MRDGMNDGSPPTDPTPNHPEHEAWARDPGALRGFDAALELPGMPEISSDFVARTWARIQADRRQIATEAARVDEAPLPPELLRAYAAPEPSSDFVARTFARLRESRASNDEDSALRDALDSFAPPPTSGDLVERTLSALRLERTRLRIVKDTPVVKDRPAQTAAEVSDRSGPAGVASSNGRPRNRWSPSRMALAAAILLVVTFGGAQVLRGLGGSGADPESAGVVVQVALPETFPPNAEDYSPTPIGTAVARSSESGHVGARLGQGDGLLLFAALDAAGTRAGGPR